MSRDQLRQLRKKFHKAARDKAKAEGDEATTTESDQDDEDDAKASDTPVSEPVAVVKSKKPAGTMPTLQKISPGVPADEVPAVIHGMDCFDCVCVFAKYGGD